ncbi:sce7726 family protein [Curvivirga sp.]|uniref:sce7726 family protein n=1 Tax=Curvivirga sp. TaxID=2856848 RepID=UPI003B5C71C4
MVDVEFNSINKKMLISQKLDNYQVAAVSRLFSASVFRELSQKGYSPLFARLATDAGILNQMHDANSVGDVFDTAFDILKKKDNRHEYAYKAALTHKVLLGIHSLNTAAMINEFRVGKSKADTVILNGTGTVYEIKSERDTLSRLDKQINDYKNVFAKVNVITGENHLEGVLKTVSKDVGVMILSERYSISTLREAQDLPERTSPIAILDSIQIKEAKAILKFLNLAIPDVPNTKMYPALCEVFLDLEASIVHRAMVEVLKKSRSLTPLSDFMGRLPNSLLPTAFSTKIRKQDHNKLFTAVNSTISEVKNWN